MVFGRHGVNGAAVGRVFVEETKKFVRDHAPTHTRPVGAKDALGIHLKKEAVQVWWNLPTCKCYAIVKQQWCLFDEEQIHEGLNTANLKVTLIKSTIWDFRIKTNKIKQSKRKQCVLDKSSASADFL